MSLDTALYSEKFTKEEDNNICLISLGLSYDILKNLNLENEVGQNSKGEK